MRKKAPEWAIAGDGGRRGERSAHRVRIPWLHRPSRAEVWLGIRLFLFIDVLIFLLYGGCNWITASRTVQFALYFPQELAIPLLPWTIWPYLSLFPLFLLLFFCVPGVTAPAVARTYLVALCFSAVLWLAFPAKLGFERVLPVGYEDLYRFVFTVDFPHNLVPSLHVVFGYLTVLVCTRCAPLSARLVLWAWFCVMVAATVFTHQHHLADALTGIFVGWASYRLVDPVPLSAYRYEGVSR